MDLAEIARRQRAAREVLHEEGGCRFTLRLPTAHESRCALLAVVPALPAAAGKARIEIGGEDLARLNRLLLERALVGWEGVHLRHLLPDLAADEDQPWPWSEAAVPLLLDAQPAWEKALRDRMGDAAERRGAALEADAKN
jgi:hypothetical protein